MMRRHRTLAILVWMLFAGAALRAGAEYLGGYEAGWGLAVAMGALLSTAAFTYFAIGLWRATGSAPSTN